MIWVPWGKSQVVALARNAFFDPPSRPYFNAELAGAIHSTNMTDGGCIFQLDPALGGGFGRHKDPFDLLLDNMVDMTVVLANGTVVHLSSTSNPDLYWGVKGAGSNLGIVTEANLKNYDFPSPRWFYAEFNPQYSTAVVSCSGCEPRFQVLDKLTAIDNSLCSCNSTMLVAQRKLSHTSSTSMICTTWTKSITSLPIARSTAYTISSLQSIPTSTVVSDSLRVIVAIRMCDAVWIDGFRVLSSMTSSCMKPLFHLSVCCVFNHHVLFASRQTTR